MLGTGFGRPIPIFTLQLPSLDLVLLERTPFPPHSAKCSGA